MTKLIPKQSFFIPNKGICEKCKKEITIRKINQHKKCISCWKLFFIKGLIHPTSQNPKRQDEIRKIIAYCEKKEKAL